jgi:hypothetical protein
MKFREIKKGRRKKNKEAQLMTKTKERQRKVTSQAKHKLHTETSKKAQVTSQAKHKLHTETSKKAPPEQMQAPPEHVDANFQDLAHLF